MDQSKRDRLNATWRQSSKTSMVLLESLMLGIQEYHFRPDAAEALFNAYSWQIKAFAEDDNNPESV